MYIASILKTVMYEICDANMHFLATSEESAIGS